MFADLKSIEKFYNFSFSYMPYKIIIERKIDEKDIINTFNLKDETPDFEDEGYKSLILAFVYYLENIKQKHIRITFMPWNQYLTQDYFFKHWDSKCIHHLKKSLSKQNNDAGYIIGNFYKFSNNKEMIRLGKDLLASLFQKKYDFILIYEINLYLDNAKATNFLSSNKVQHNRYVEILENLYEISKPINNRYCFYLLAQFYYVIKNDAEKMGECYLMSAKLGYDLSITDYAAYYRNLMDFEKMIEIYKKGIKYGFEKFKNELFFVYNLQKNIEKMEEIYFTMDDTQKNINSYTIIEFYVTNDFPIEKIAKIDEICSINSCLSHFRINKKLKNLFINYLKHQNVNLNIKKMYESDLKSSVKYKNTFKIKCMVKNIHVKDIFIHPIVLDSEFFETLLTGKGFQKSEILTIHVENMETILQFIKFLYLRKINYEEIDNEILIELLELGYMYCIDPLIIYIKSIEWLNIIES